MPRVTHVKAARKDYPEHGIKRGESYYHWAFMQGGRGGPKRFSKTPPKPSQLTQSDFWSAVYSAQESIGGAPDLDDMESQIADLSGEIGNIKDETEGKLDNMPDGLRDGDSGQLLQERVDALEECCGILDSIDTSFDEPEKEEGETDEDFETRLGAARANRAEEIWSEVEDAINGISCS